MLFYLKIAIDSTFKTKTLEFWPRWRHRQKLVASSHNQKEDNNQSKITKQPEAPENQTAWNSDNQGIKEKINQNNQTSKAADCAGWAAQKNQGEVADGAGGAG